MATKQTIRWTLIATLCLAGGALNAAKAEESPTTKPDSNSSNSRREQLKQRFGNMDPSKLAELRKRREAGSTSTPSPAGVLANVDLDALFKKLDTNGDGKLSAEEFKKLTDELPSGAPVGGTAASGTPSRGAARGNIDPERLKQLRERFGNRRNTAQPSDSKPADPATPTDKPADATKPGDSDKPKE